MCLLTCIKCCLSPVQCTVSQKGMRKKWAKKQFQCLWLVNSHFWWVQIYFKPISAKKINYKPSHSVRKSSDDHLNHIVYCIVSFFAFTIHSIENATLTLGQYSTRQPNWTEKLHKTYYIAKKSPSSDDCRFSKCCVFCNILYHVLLV